MARIDAALLGQQISDARYDADPVQYKIDQRKYKAAQQQQQQHTYLDNLFNRYADASLAQTITSTATNLAGMGLDFMQYKRAKDRLEVPEFRVPPKEPTTLYRPDVTREYDQLAAKTFNTGVQQAREMGRPELIPGITRRSQEIAEKGIQEQAKSDMNIANAQANVDFQTNQAYNQMLFQAEGAQFQMEAEMNLQRNMLDSAFIQNLQQGLSAQADITNKALIDPIQVSQDWMTNYGWINKGIYDKSTEDAT